MHGHAFAKIVAGATSYKKADAGGHHARAIKSRVETAVGIVTHKGEVKAVDTETCRSRHHNFPIALQSYSATAIAPEVGGHLPGAAKGEVEIPRRRDCRMAERRKCSAG